MNERNTVEKYVKDDIIVRVEVDTDPLNPKEEFDFWGEAEYNAYCRGEVFGFEIVELKKCECCKHTAEEILDSCWGFYGMDFASNGIYDSIKGAGYDLKEFEEVKV